ncbi:MAG: sigma-70 family RNA polymerase sigma factor [Candidatus Latescibacteria bacterium]|nr:sigma-70 family RNA polymerase sigma factor [Candidatus Latescibacterota bacterium]
MDDLELYVRQAAGGDPDAFGQVVRRFQDMAVGYAYAVLGDFHLAQDAAQEAFVQAYKDLDSLVEPMAFPGWLRRLVFKFCDRQRRGWRLQTATLEGQDEVVAEGADPAVLFDRSQRQDLVRRAIQELSLGERQAVSLYYIGEYSQGDIAAFLDISPGAVRKRLYDARGKLRERMLDMVQESFQQQAPSRDDRFAHQVLTSALPLQMYWIDEGGQEHDGGTTAGDRQVQIPDSAVWLVEPRAELTDQAWDRLLGLMRERRIPGLRAGGRLDDRHLRRIGELEHLVYLDLSGWNTGISDAGLAHLGQLGQLRHLDLNLNSANNHPRLAPAAISDGGLACLAHLPELRTLSLNYLFNITDAGIGYLRGHQHLERVQLECTATGDGAIDLLGGKDGLRHFVAGTQVTDAGLAGLKAFPALGRSGGGGSLNLARSYGITDAGLAQVAGLQGVSRLGLPESRLYNDWVEHMPVAIQRQAQYGAAGIAHLRAMPDLYQVGISGDLMDDQVMAAVGALPALRELSAGAAVASDRGFAALAQCRSLERLAAYSCHGLTGKGLAAWAQLPRLQFLYVGGACLADEGLAALGDFAALREFWTGNDNIFTDRVFEYIVRAPGLERLLNMYCRATGDRATQYVVAGAAPLKWYGIMGTTISDNSLELLATMPSLEELTLENLKGITNAGVAQLGRSKRLRQVQINGCAAVSYEVAANLPSRMQVDFSA